MKVYLVGGAVRDQLLDLPVKDRDWIVVGTDPATLLSLGYQQVGKDFPVFLNPKTKEEYALARTERKSSTGYTGFICDFSPTITLEQDLIRRDLTINAMAQSEDGEIIDPYGGKQDLENRILRHISPAFSEDPLRVLRVARFAARYHSLGFKIASETLALMAELAQSGELQHLTAERIWLETEKALNEKNPEIYFETLHKTGALSVLFSEIDALHGVPNPVKHHPEVDSFIHTMLVLKQAVNLTENNPILNKSAVRFAAICHDLGKALTPQNILPHHYGHEQAGIKPTRSLCKRLKVPSYFQELAELTCEFHTHIHKAFELRAETVITLFNRFDVWRKSQRFQEFLQVCLADTRGRTGFETKDYPQIDYINQLLHSANEVDVQQVIADGFEKQAIKNELTKRRILAVKQTKANYPTN
ncbi:TPA: multifunctional CCA addition/repair protein [Haemophilus influenzae]|uniref:multifunctional CCA addition/repair protein n=1 Tax=Haemophilus influenzae TaxID=727 RepID=UPI000682EBAB|nr:multifunctional CCA addition/repair protein [Haemophilus influenzae]AXP78358.1 multifunctional CCA addition/repair protein [Haemophilus influenzae]KMZ22859.1 2', 3'-cyclic nucleotide 2'-phosphodiesterase [Haemophilus influenzae]MCK9030795.1 multifunctional CCA addition/repair protein [Haemophilus influenzae]MCK9032688.1 multifunctional CCA addition/repair protein [Haemophilus influenzae]PRI28027.1 Multifunctional CCA protein [Haemophilus influenzae]